MSRAAIRNACIVAAAARVMSAVAALPAHASEDFNGIWKVIDPKPRLLTTKGEAPPLLPQAKKLYEQHLAARKAGDTSFDGTALCMPPGAPRILSLSPFRIVAQKDVVGFVFEWNHIYRPIYLNGMRTENDEETHYFGEAVGRWVNGTLAVDTIHFSDTTLLDAATPHSDALHLTERYQLEDGGKVLVVDITIEDPQTFSAPWSAQLRFARQPLTAVLNEDVCTDRLKLVPTLNGAMPESQANAAKK